MTIRLLPFILCTLVAHLSFAQDEDQHVVLLHGLARTPAAMEPMRQALADRGYRVWNLGYPTRKMPAEELARYVRREIVSRVGDARTVHVVGHSLGGIVMRQIQATDPLPFLGRVVMLSPPSQGSEVVDALYWLWPYQWINGPVGQQLGTGPDSVPNRLGPANFDAGILTGDRTINPINTLFLIPGRDDGKVSTVRARLDGMRDFRVLHVSHAYIMKDAEAIAETIHYLETGLFRPEAKE